MQIAVDVARGLAYMHAKKAGAIIHRDLKPANLMISGSMYQSQCAPHTQRAARVLMAKHEAPAGLAAPCTDAACHVTATNAAMRPAAGPGPISDVQVIDDQWVTPCVSRRWLCTGVLSRAARRQGGAGV